MASGKARRRSPPHVLRQEPVAVSRSLSLRCGAPGWKHKRTSDSAAVRQKWGRPLAPDLRLANEKGLARATVFMEIGLASTTSRGARPSVARPSACGSPRRCSSPYWSGRRPSSTSTGRSSHRDSARTSRESPARRWRGTRSAPCRRPRSRFRRGLRQSGGAARQKLPGSQAERSSCLWVAYSLSETGSDL